MSFFSRNQTPAEEQGYHRLNSFMLDIGGITDEICREVALGGLADMRASRLQQALEIEKAAPGYRQELNLLRAKHGLPPL